MYTYIRVNIHMHTHVLYYTYYIILYAAKGTCVWYVVWYKHYLKVPI